jgi:hypothetical protein
MIRNADLLPNEELERSMYNARPCCIQVKED